MSFELVEKRLVVSLVKAGAVLVFSPTLPTTPSHLVVHRQGQLSPLGTPHQARSHIVVGGGNPLEGV